jgi:gliding motility-associated-like protein
MFIEVVPYPVFELVPDDVFCDGGYQTVHGPEGYDQYLWSTGETTVNAIAPLEGRITLEVTSLPNCTTRDTLDYFIEDCIGEFPNIFTPNGDSQNGGVDFGWLRIPIDEVIIFNRWGTQIRTLGGPDFVWRGEMDNGEDASDGVYYYIVKSPVPGRQFKNTSGYIHLKR